MTAHIRMALARAALFSLPLLSLACGGGEEKPKIKDPPQTTLSVPQPNTVGSKLTVMVSATGCEQISSLSIYDGNDFLKAVPYGGGGGQVSVDLLVNEVKYTRGIAAQLSLRSRVICDEDQREAYSQPQGAVFFPAAEVVEPPAGSNLQVVPDYFIAEGSGANVSFIGCGNELGGIPKLYRVTKLGAAISTISVSLPFLCTGDVVITPKHPVTGKRWVYLPNGGAIAVDAALNISGRTDIQLDLLAVGPDGDAIVYDAGTGGTAKAMYRVSHENGATKWEYSPQGYVISTPVVNSNQVVLVPSITSVGAPTNRAFIKVSSVDYGNLNNPNPGTGGIETGSFVLKEVASPDAVPTSAPPTTFSADGTTLYMSFDLLGGLSQVLACATQSNGCDGAAQKWRTPPTLNGRVLVTAPYANGSRVAAIAAQAVWVLDASTGAVLNKNTTPLYADGALVVNRIQSGGGNQFPTAFYMMNSAAPQNGLPAPMPVEIVGTEDPANGELFRYSINTGSLSAAVDDAGVLWMRVGQKLARPLPLGDYRKVRP